MARNELGSLVESCVPPCAPRFSLKRGLSINISYLLCALKYVGQNRLTNCSDDGGPAEVFGWIVFGVELGQPFDSSASSVQMVESVRHAVSKWISRLLAGVLGLSRKISVRGSLSFC